MGKNHSFLREVGKTGAMPRDIHGERVRARARIVVLEQELTRQRGLLARACGPKPADAATREGEERFRMIADLSPACLWMTDAGGGITFINRYYCNFFGVTGEAVLGRPWAPPIHPEDAEAFLGGFRAAVRDQKAFRGEFRTLRVDGEWRWALSLLTPHFSPAGEFMGYMGVLPDIDERKKAEEAVREARDSLEGCIRERTEELEQRARQLRALTTKLTRVEERERRHLAEVLHDDLQQLLVATKMRASLLKNAKDREAIVDLLAQCISTTRSVTSELSPPILYDGDLPTALEGMVRQKCEKYGLKVALRLDRAADPGGMDARILLYRGARELLLNVSKHADVSCAILTLTREEGGIRLQVADEGSGFDPEAAANCKDKGFGLFSLRERLEPLGGEVVVDSAPGQGARITLVLPVSEETHGMVSMPNPMDSGSAPVAQNRALRVLMVDDHRILRQGLVGLMVDQIDITVVGEAGDGLEAIEQARILQPDVIIMDINMPRMNGIEATKAIHGEMPHIKVIGLSVHSSDGMEAKMRRAGAIAYLDKSGPGDDLIAAIRACREQEGEISCR